MIEIPAFKGCMVSYTYEGATTDGVIMSAWLRFGDGEGVVYLLWLDDGEVVLVTHGVKMKGSALEVLCGEE